MGFRQYCMLWLLPLLWARADEAPGRCLVQDLSWERVAPEDLLVPAHCEGVDLSWTKVKIKRRHAHKWPCVTAPPNSFCTHPTPPEPIPPSIRLVTGE